MSNYVKAVDFSAKDALASGNPNKIIKGTEINDEYNAIATAIGTKSDLASPAFLGNPTAVTQPSGNSSTRLATTAFVQQEITSTEASVAITGGTITGVAITNGTISGLDTPLAVASGGTGLATLSANNVLLGNGTSSIQVVAPSTDGNVLTSNGTTWVSETPAGTLGNGQTWQNVSGSRAIGTTYTNSTGKPIQVNAIITVATNNSSSLSVGGVEVSRLQNQFGDRPLIGTLSAVVPNGVSYVITPGTITIWAELR